MCVCVCVCERVCIGVFVQFIHLYINMHIIQILIKFGLISLMSQLFSMSSMNVNAVLQRRATR